MPNARKKPTNLTLDPALMSEARGLGVNLSQAAEAGLRAAVREAREEVWRKQNAEAIAASNAWVEAHGLPLAKHRMF